MHKVTIGGAFAATFAFLGAHWLRMLAVMLIALLVMGALGFVLVGSVFAQLASGNADPSLIFASFTAVLLLVLGAGILILAACFYIWRSALGADDLGRNLAFAFKAGAITLLFLIGCYFGLSIAIGIAGIALLAFVGGAGLFDPAAATGTALIVIVMTYAAFLAAFLYLQARLAVTGAVMADLRTANPLTGISRSWRMTAPSRWPLIGFFVLLGVASFAAASVIALAGGAIGGAGPALILYLLYSLAYTLFSLAVPPALYRLMVRTERSAVFD